MTAAPSCRAGVGLRPVHFPRLLERPRTQVRWFEAISENFMDSEGRPIAVLETIRADYPVALHGVSMSIGRAEGLRTDYLSKLKALVERINPFLVSDHLCWTGLKKANLHDLLPLPYTEEALRLLAPRVRRVQDLLKRRFLLENVSSYLTYPESEMTEWEFLAELSRRTGCGILLDINNIYVSAKNHGFDPLDYLNGIPPAAVGQIHLAGHTDMGTHLFDTHSKPVCAEVWDLFAREARRLPAGLPVLIEWDEDIPPWERLEAEAVRAAKVWDEARAHALA